MATLQLCRNGHEMTSENTYMYKARGRPRAYPYCRSCRAATRRAGREGMRDYMLARRYGITRKERSDLLVSQDGLCAVCYERPATVVDHDHDTGCVRGMLCKGCNTAIGVLGDEAGLQRALEYLTHDLVGGR